MKKMLTIAVLTLAVVAVLAAYAVPSFAGTAGDALQTAKEKKNDAKDKKDDRMDWADGKKDGAASTAQYKIEDVRCKTGSGCAKIPEDRITREKTEQARTTACKAKGALSPVLGPTKCRT